MDIFVIVFVNNIHDWTMYDANDDDDDNENENNSFNTKISDLLND